MKQLFRIDDTLENKISYYHIAAFLIFLPFDRFYSELVFISFILHTLIHINKKKLRAAFTFQNLVVSSVFFISLAGILYSQDKTQGLSDLQKQMAILLFPLSLAACGLDLRKYKMNLLLVFSFTCILTILYLYVDAIRIILYYKLPLSALLSLSFINQNFSSPINMHASYLAMYTLLSAAILFYAFLRESRNTRRIIYLISIVILFAGLMQLASRAVLISAIIITPFFPFFMLSGAKRVKLVLIMAAGSVVAGLLITNISSFKTRYVAQLKDDLTQSFIINENPEPRITRWHYTLVLIGKSPVFGYGSGSEKRLLNETYFENKLYTSYLNNLNAHNQYLSILLKTGAWGLLIFLFTLVTGFATALRNKDILFACFMTIISTVSFSENLLDVNKGIFFYAFFFSLFMQSGKPFASFSRFKNKGINPAI